MKTRSIHWIVGIVLMATALAMALAAFISGASRQDIPPRSLLVWLVDSEIRSMPALPHTRVISYRTEPNDGNKPSVSALRLLLENNTCECEALTRHLKALGYTAVSGQEFQRQDQSIVIRLDAPHLDIIKYGAP